MVSEPHLIWETKRDKKTDDYDKGPAKTNTEGGNKSGCAQFLE